MTLNNKIKKIKVKVRVEENDNGSKNYFFHLPYFRGMDKLWLNGDNLSSYYEQGRKDEREKCLEIIKRHRPIDFTTNGQKGEQESEILYQTQTLIDEILQALKNNPKTL